MVILVVLAKCKIIVCWCSRMAATSAGYNARFDYVICESNNFHSSLVVYRFSAE